MSLCGHCSSGFSIDFPGVATVRIQEETPFSLDFIFEGAYWIVFFASDSNTTVCQLTGWLRTCAGRAFQTHYGKKSLLHCLLGWLPPSWTMNRCFYPVFPVVTELLEPVSSLISVFTTTNFCVVISSYVRYFFLYRSGK